MTIYQALDEYLPRVLLERPGGDEPRSSSAASLCGVITKFPFWPIRPLAYIKLLLCGDGWPPATESLK